MALDFNSDYDKDFLESLKFIKVKEIYKNLSKSDKNIILKQVDHLLTTSMENPEYISLFGYYEKDENVKISLVFLAMKSFIELYYPLNSHFNSECYEVINQLINYIKKFSFIFYWHYDFSKEVIEEYGKCLKLLKRKQKRTLLQANLAKTFLKIGKFKNKGLWHLILIMKIMTRLLSSL